MTADVEKKRSEWQSAINKWLADSRAWMATKTARQRRCMLNAFARDCGRGPWDVRTVDVVRYVSAGRCPESRKNRRGALRSFYQWAVRAELVERNPVDGCPPIRVPQALPRPVAEDVLTAAFELTQCPRLRLFLALGAYGGLRVEEIAALHTDNVVTYPLGRALRFAGKGNAERVVPVNESLAAHLEPYLAQHAPASGFLFPTPHPKYEHISGGHVGKLIKRALASAATAHQLRHRCLTQAYSATQNIVAVQRLAGHTSIRTTQRYVALGDDALWDAADAAA